MSSQVQLRRGTTAQHSVFTGADGEITVDSDKKTVVVHDGTTVGGTPLATSTLTDVEVKTAYENNADTNAFTDAEKNLLGTVTQDADVTGSGNVAAAGAIMDSDITAGEGLLRKTGAGTYVALKSNLGATTNPVATSDSAAGYGVGSEWVNTTTKTAFKCLAPTVGAAVWKETTNLGSGAPDAVLEDQKPSGTAGGPSFAAWTKRDLNTKVIDPDGLISLVSSEFTPIAGCWIEWSSPAYAGGNHKTSLYNVTDSTLDGYGSTEFASTGGSFQSMSIGGAVVQAGKTYRIEHRVSTAKITNGFGAQAVLGTEVYSRVKFWRI